MHHSTVLSLLASSLSLLSPTFALPTEAELVPRACVTEYPSFLTTIQQSSPNTIYGNTQYTIVAQNANRANEIDTLIEFTNIPAGAYGCQLEFFAPPGYTVTGIGSTQLNVYVPTRDVQSSDSWATAPGNSYLFGTVTLSSQPNAPTKIVVNSLTCKPTLSFRVRIASDTASGRVETNQQNPPANPTAGWRITHNC